MATADRLERQIQAAKAAPKPTPAPRPVTAAAKPVAAAPKPTAPVVSRPQVAPTVATPQRTALASMGGSADARERQAVAAKAGITQSAAAAKINAQTQAQLAAQGTRSSRPTGGSADRMEAAQASKIYGVPQGQAQKIINTQVDVQRAAQGLRPVYKPQEKVSRIPAPLVRSSGPGSLMSGWQSTGPVSSVTGRPLIPNLTQRDASQDLRDSGIVRTRSVGEETIEEIPEETVAANGSRNLSRVDQEALSTMIHESGGPMNLLEPVSGSERKVTQIDAPERVVRNLAFQPVSGPMRRRNTFLRGM